MSSNEDNNNAADEAADKPTKFLLENFKLFDFDIRS
jgi:hypothetical protein